MRRPADLKAIEARLDEAGQTLLMLPFPADGVPRGHRVQWPAIVIDFWEALGGLSEAEIVRWAEERNRTPMPRILDASRIDRMDEAVRWVHGIGDRGQRFVVAARMLVHPISGRHIASWRRLARQTGLSHEGVRCRHAAGLRKILTNLTIPAYVAGRL